MMFKAFFTVSSLTLVSRILGFVRDILIAAWVGAGPLMDAFLVAFKLPNFFRRLFAEGAFSAAFVPLYSGMLGDEHAAKQFASRIMTGLAATLMLLTLLAELFMPAVISLLAPGFNRESPLFTQAVALARITFPYLLCIALVSLLSGVLNAHKRYAAGAAAPILLNLSMIAGLFYITPYVDTNVHALAWGVCAAGGLQLLWLIANCLRHGLMPTIHIGRTSKELKTKTSEFFRKFVPGVLGAGIVQINLWIDIIIATFIPSAISYLYFADRVVQLPLSLIGTAMGTALLPLLARLVGLRKNFRVRYQQNRAMDLVLFFTLPATAGLITIAYPIISTLFERGAFDQHSALASSYAMQAYGVGLPAFVLLKLLTTSCFAHGDTKTPVRVSLVALVTNLTLNLTFVWYFPKIGLMPHIGLALATSLAAWLNVVILWRYLALKRWLLVDIRAKRHIVRVFACTAVMTGLLLLLADIFTGIFGLFLLIISGIVDYALAAIVLGALPKHRFFRRWRQKMPFLA